MYTSATDNDGHDGYGRFDDTVPDAGYYRTSAGADNPIGSDRTRRPNGARDRRAFLVYLGVTAFCIVFELVYAHFSHGVSSAYMTWAFLYPAIGGVMTFMLLAYVSRRSLRQVSYNAWNSGIATLTLGSIVAGVFEIAGTASSYQVVFTAVGIAFIAVAITGFLTDRW